jgi:hypothetical protein
VKEAPSVPETTVEIPAEKKEVIPAPVNKPSSVTDIRSIMGLNEKLMLMKNLFGGDTSAFDAVMNALNSTSAKQDSLELARKFAGEKGWKTDGEAFATLLSLINRRSS